MATQPARTSRRTERSFERIYRDHVGDVYRYALALTGNASDAEDVAQTTFMNAYRAFERGERPLKPQNWLIVIAHNVCRQRARQSDRRPREVEFNEDLAEAIVPSEDAPTAADIQRALGHLAFNQRAALVMRELEGRSHAEIAEALGLTVAATEMLVFRARRALREQLAGSLTCTDAEAAIGRQIDGLLSRTERPALRAHLRECDDCAGLARRQRAQSSAWKALAVAPLPASLSSFAGGGSVAAVGAGLVAKAAAVTVAVAVAGGGYEVARHTALRPAHHTTTGSVVNSRTTHAATPKPALTATHVPSHRNAPHRVPPKGPAQTSAASTSPVTTPAAPPQQSQSTVAPTHTAPSSSSAAAHVRKRATPTHPVKPHKPRKHTPTQKPPRTTPATPTPAGGGKGREHNPKSP
jgi:RNA polymerase sigma factor (sigma-70 family)